MAEPVNASAHSPVTASAYSPHSAPGRATQEHAPGAHSTPARTTRPVRLTPLLTKLRWTTQWRQLKKNIPALIGTIFGLLYAAVLLVMLVGLMGTLAVQPLGDGAYPQVVRGAGGLVVLLWTLVPVLAFGLDDILSPARFGTFGRRAKELQAPMLIASFASVPVVVTALGLAAFAVTQALHVIVHWADVPAAQAITAIIALAPAAVCTFLLCVLFPRAILSWRGTRQTSRGAREVSGAIALISALAVAYGFSLFSQGLSNADSRAFDTLAQVLTTAVTVLAWTPFGAPLSVPMDLFEGQWLRALARILITAGAIAALWLWWRSTLAIAMTEALRGERASHRAKVTALVPRWMPQNQLGAGVGRTLRYFRRDLRYSVSLLMAPMIGVFFLAMSLMSGGPMVYGAGIVLAWMAGMTIFNEIGNDGPANWVNITADANPRTLLLSRVLVTGVLIGVIAVIVSIMSLVLQNRPNELAWLIPLTLGMLAASLGVGAFTAGTFPFPAPKPGSMKNSSSAAAWLPTLVGMVGMWLPILPSIIMIMIGQVTGQVLLSIGGGVLALVVGAVVLWLGTRLGAASLQRRWPDLAFKVRSFNA